MLLAEFIVSGTANYTANQAAQENGINHQRISQGLAVLDYAPDMVSQVVGGHRTLDNAHKGRNRLAACNLAGVTPTFDYYTGEDPVGYVLFLNNQRRHMTKGQLAMVVVEAQSLRGEDSYGSIRAMAKSNYRLSKLERQE